MGKTSLDGFCSPHELEESPCSLPCLPVYKESAIYPRKQILKALLLPKCWQKKRKFFVLFREIKNYNQQKSKQMLFFLQPMWIKSKKKSA